MTDQDVLFQLPAQAKEIQDAWDLTHEQTYEILVRLESEGKVNVRITQARKQQKFVEWVRT